MSTVVKIKEKWNLPLLHLLFGEGDHSPPKRGHTLRDLQTRQLANLIENRNDQKL